MQGSSAAYKVRVLNHTAHGTPATRCPSFARHSPRPCLPSPSARKKEPPNSHMEYSCEMHKSVTVVGMSKQQHGSFVCMLGCENVCLSNPSVPVTVRMYPYDQWMNTLPKYSSQSASIASDTDAGESLASRSTNNSLPPALRHASHPSFERLVLASTCIADP